MTEHAKSWSFICLFNRWTEAQPKQYSSTKCMPWRFFFNR